MKLSLSTASLYHYPLRWIFSMAAQLGFAGLELVLGPEAIVRGPAYLNRLSEDYALPILTIHPPAFQFPGWGRLTCWPKLVDFAAAVDCPIMIIHPPRIKSFDSVWGRTYLDTLAISKEKASRTGTEISLENRACFRKDDRELILNDGLSLRRFAEKHDLSLTLDTSHVGSSDETLMAMYRAFRGRLSNVHVSDERQLPRFLDKPYLYTHFKQHQMPGHGILPLTHFLAQLTQDGYRGPVTLEVSPIPLRAWWPPCAKRRLAQALAFTKEGLDLFNQPRSLNQS
ncbi:MAG: sugar phosphate isomerase/epimerase family protein [Anaerolineae bacterium]